MSRHKGIDWDMPDHPSGGVERHEDARLAVLMDLRDELKQLNRVFACHNFQAVPDLLRAIKSNTTKPRKKKR